MKYEVIDKEGNFVLLTSNKGLAELTAKEVDGSIIETYLAQSELAQANSSANRQDKRKKDVKKSIDKQAQRCYNKYKDKDKRKRE